MVDNTTDQYLRPPGAFERIIDPYMHRNPLQFSLTTGLTRDVSEEELTRALRKLQRVHPLLAAEVDRGDHDDHRATGAVFRRSARAIPVRVARETTWGREAAIEQTEPIEPAPGPLARAVLIPAGNGRAGATVVVTFAHQIADGRGALRAVEDLAAILDGAPLAPSGPPVAQDDLLADLAPTDGPDEGAVHRDAEPAGEPGADATASPPGRLRPFDGSLPIVQTGDLGAPRIRQLESVMWSVRLLRRRTASPAAGSGWENPSKYTR